MAYQFRLYAPTGAGIISLSITNSNGVSLGNVAPAGTSTPCFNQSGLTVGVNITPYLEDGVTVSRWVINADGELYYQYGSYCTIGYDSAYTNIQVRLEVEGTPTRTYYVNLEFDPNGGTGGPSYAGPFEGETSTTVRVTIPTSEPTRQGYIFVGWNTRADGTGTTYYPGVTYNNWYGSTSENYTQTLYAVWSEDETGGVYLGNGYNFDHYIPYIWNGGWKKAVPYVWNGGWKKGI